MQFKLSNCSFCDVDIRGHCDLIFSLEFVPRGPNWTEKWQVMDDVSPRDIGRCCGKPLSEVFLCACAALCIECVYMGIWRYEDLQGVKQGESCAEKRHYFFLFFLHLFFPSSQALHPLCRWFFFLKKKKSWATEYSALTSSIYNVLDYVLVAFSISSLRTA